MLASTSVVSHLGRIRQRVVRPRSGAANYQHSILPARLQSRPSSSSSPSYTRSLAFKFTAAGNLPLCALRTSRWSRRMFSTSKPDSSQDPISDKTPSLQEAETGAGAPSKGKETDTVYKQKLEALLKEMDKLQKQNPNRAGPKDKFTPQTNLNTAFTKSSQPKSTPNSTDKPAGAKPSSSRPTPAQPASKPSHEAESPTLPAESTSHPSHPGLEKPDRTPQNGEQTSTSAPPSGDEVLGRITPKRLTLEEAEALGIDVSKYKTDSSTANDGSGDSSALGESDAASDKEKEKIPTYETPEQRSKREKEEALKKAAKKDGKPAALSYIGKAADWSKRNYLWFIVAGIAVIPLFMDDRIPVSKRSNLQYREAWHRHEYSSIANYRTQIFIFELCGLAAVSALPPFNPITSPLSLVRGEIRPVYPVERQGSSPPTIWKLRIDFPAPRETVWEKNDVRQAVVVPASPTYKGTQFMWILSRTWERGEPVIRILMGKQVGGTIKANPKRSLIPWRMPVFRPRRMEDEFLRKGEMDLLYHELYMDNTHWYQAIKRWGDIKDAESKMIEWNIDDLEYEMLEQKGYGDLLYNPNSTEWPENKTLIIDPLNIADYEEKLGDLRPGSSSSIIEPLNEVDDGYGDYYGDEDQYGPTQFARDGPDGYEHSDPYDNLEWDPNEPYPDDQYYDQDEPYPETHDPQARQPSRL